MRPREKLVQTGPHTLSNEELLCIIIGSGSKKHSVFELATNVHRTKPTLYHLQKIPGIGLAKACQLVAAYELGKRKPQTPPKTYTHAKAIYAQYAYLSQRKQEQALVLCLDTKLALLHAQVLAVGTLDTVIIHPRDIFKYAIDHGAHSIVLIHNHPSGDPSPSEQDTYITERLQETGRIIGIQLLDHIIIGNERYWSFQENQRV